jgi:hypothetical protein
MPCDNEQTEQSEYLMRAFAARTGLTSDKKPTRYLWTDAFAVSNFLGLARAIGKKEYIDLACRLIDQVHETLGRHRKDDPRTGWISGLGEKEGRKHPTKGGLRIGKRLPERRRDEPFDHYLEWERDGQYFHYLTKWMHALDLTARETGKIQYAIWSFELMHAARKAFVYRDPSGQTAMHWKMSIDLSRPLAASMGQHDPLEGYITLRQLQATAENMPDIQKEHLLENINFCEDLDVFEKLTQDRNWKTTDPLGLGGLLIDSVRLMQIGSNKLEDRDLISDMLHPAAAGIQAWMQSGYLGQLPSQRLAFRELGLATGIRAYQRLEEQAGDLKAAMKKADDFYAVGEKIIRSWLDPDIREVSIWKEHEDINAVMLATALYPQGFVKLSQF